MVLKRLFLLAIICFYSCNVQKQTVDTATENKDSNRYESFVFEEVNITSDVVYGSNTTQGGKAKELKMDIYEPSNDAEEKRNLIIIAHGGGFYAGNKASMKKMATYFAKSGYVVASINYRLLDVWPTQEILKYTVLNAVFDMKAAVRFFKKDAAKENRYKINPNTIYVGGYSAGAVMALNYAYVNSDKEIESVGGEKMVAYVKEHGGMEGDSGNEGYDSRIKGVINISGSLFFSEHVDENEPILFSIHGTNDQTVPYEKGDTNSTGIISEGSSLIHKEAEEVGITNSLYTIEEGGHRAYRVCDDCHDRIRSFLSANY